MKHIFWGLIVLFATACGSSEASEEEDRPNPMTEATSRAPYEQIIDTIAMSGNRFLYSKDKSRVVLTGAVDVLVFSADSAVVVLTDEVRSIELRGSGSKLYYTRVKPDYEPGIVEYSPTTTVDTLPVTSTGE